MKTDAKTMAEIYRHMADNLDNGLFIYSGIEILINGGEKWDIIDNDIYKMDFKNICYRLKPKTITLSNGVVIPEPLSEKTVEINQGMNFYIPMCSESLSECVGFSWVRNFKPKFVYLDEDKAIEASKALFGLS